MSKELKIISFGSLLKELGGNLTTGLARVIWQLAHNINNENDICVALTVIDYPHEKSVINGVNIIGWTKACIIKYMFKNPLLTIRYFFIAINIHLFYPVNPKFIGTFIYLLFFNKTIKEENCDVIHIHGVNYIYFHYIKAALKKVKIITIHGITGFDSNIKNYKSLRKIEKIITSNKFERIIFITSDLRKEWCIRYGKPVSPTKVICNAYDSTCFFNNCVQKSNTDKIVLVTVGTIANHKSQINVVKALSQFPEKDKFEYWIIGTGNVEYVKKISALVDKHGLNVHFLGELSQQEIANKLNQADYMILTSSSEGFGLVYIESIACGTKVIIPSNLPLAKEKNILNEINAVFLKDNSVESISSCLYDLLNNNIYSKPEVAKTVIHLSWDKIAKQYGQIIRNIKK
jgi:glycosyltransferase involved in cell wall biosynthesis